MKVVFLYVLIPLPNRYARTQVANGIANSSECDVKGQEGYAFDLFGKVRRNKAGLPSMLRSCMTLWLFCERGRPYICRRMEITG